MQIDDADLIGIVRSLRKLISALDAIGRPIKDIELDEELVKLIPKKAASNIIAAANDAHKLAQQIENSKRYKEAIKQLCSVKIRGQHE